MELNWGKRGEEEEESGAGSCFRRRSEFPVEYREFASVVLLFAKRKPPIQ